eukprot:m.68920 g.68920  ORF g.68920 m.68920 type:complete len:97 (-) comp8550_c0_seq1:1106-1396(-)
MLAKEGWVVVYESARRWRDFYAVLRINEDSKTLSIQYFKKPGDFQASGTFSCGVESAVEVLEPPHVGEKGWPEQRVVRLKLGSDEMHANKVPTLQT